MKEIKSSNVTTIIIINFNSLPRPDGKSCLIVWGLSVASLCCFVDIKILCPIKLRSLPGGVAGPAVSVIPLNSDSPISLLPV